MFCPLCGKEIEKGNKFCRHCGNEVTKELKDVTKKATKDQKKREQELKSKKQKSKGKGGPGKAVVGVAAVAAIGVAGFLGYQYGDSKGWFNSSSEANITEEETKETEALSESIEETVEASVESTEAEASSEEASIEESSTEETMEESTEETTEETVEEITEDVVEMLVEEEVSLEAMKIRSKYADILARAYYIGKLPGMSDDDPGIMALSGWEEFNGADYTIVDVNQDGKEELILSFVNGSMADQFLRIYRYNEETDTVDEMLCDCPALVTFYDNNTVKFGWSHNQGYGDIIWPYNAYRYNTDTNTYELVVSVDSVNRDTAEQRNAEDQFDFSYDVDGDGNIYEIQNLGEDIVYMDGEEFAQLEESIFADAKVLKFEWLSTTDTSFNRFPEEYLKELARENMKDISSDVIELGGQYILGEGHVHFIEDMVRDVTEDFVTTEFDVTQATVGEDVIVEFYMEDNGGFTYLKAIPELTLFGVTPGMSVEEADASLKKYGFSKVNEEDTFYKTGDAYGNYYLTLISDQGKVISIGVTMGSSYTG